MTVNLFINGLFQKLDAHPVKKTCTVGILKILLTVFIGKSQKMKHFFGRKGKEDMEIPKIFERF